MQLFRDFGSLASFSPHTGFQGGPRYGETYIKRRQEKGDHSKLLKMCWSDWMRHHVFPLLHSYDQKLFRDHV